MTEKIKAMLAETLNIDPDSITDETELGEIGVYEYLETAVELSFVIEDEFDIMLDDAEFRAMANGTMTVGELAAAIESRMTDEQRNEISR
jgi:acyl carrier protein